MSFALSRARPPRVLHQQPHQPGKSGLLGPSEKAVEDVFRGYSGTSHSVWGRVVEAILAFCRELVAALAEE